VKTILSEVKANFFTILWKGETFDISLLSVYDLCLLPQVVSRLH